MWQNNGYGMDVTETTWDAEMMRRGRSLPGVKSPFQSTVDERWQQKHSGLCSLFQSQSLLFLFVTVEEEKTHR